MSHHDSLTPPRGERHGCLVVLGTVLAAFLLTLLITGLLLWRTAVSVTDTARQTGEILAAEFQRTLNFTPEIRVNSVVIVAASTPVSEFVVLEKKALVRHRWTQTWLHSTKNFEIEATFTAKAGFDLTEPFQVDIDPATKTVGALLPAPRILSFGMGEVRILRDEDGLWNKLTEADREQAFAALEKKAREQLENSSFLAEARTQAEERIAAVLQAAGQDVEIRRPRPQVLR
jgi:hypothetical protein